MIPPGPRSGVLLGSLPEVRRDPLAFLLRVSAEYGDIVHVRLARFACFCSIIPTTSSRCW